MSDTNQKEYEILYFLSITLGPEEIKTIQKKIADIITKHEGVIIKEEDLGKKRLAFTIKRARHGYYLITVFKSNPNKVKTIDEEIKLLPEVKRHRLTLKQNIKAPIARSLEMADGSVKEEKNLSEKKPEPKKEKTTVEEIEKKKVDKVDIQELDKKIDELLSEDDI